MIKLVLVFVAVALMSMAAMHILGEIRRQYKTLDEESKKKAKSIASSTVLSIVLGFTLLFFVVILF